MSLDALCAMVWTDDAVLDRLRSIRSIDAFVERAISIAAEKGMVIDADELRDRMRSNALYLSISSVPL